VTDTIGWGDVDDKPRRLDRLPWAARVPRVPLRRRQRIALLVVAALVVGLVAAWPPFRSWRADEAARHVQRIWARAEGLDIARVAVLASAQIRIATVDKPTFDQAVGSVDDEEVVALAALRRQTLEMRTWAGDVAAASRAVSAALAADIRGLKAESARRNTLATDQSLSTVLDEVEGAAVDAAEQAVDRLAVRRHLKPLAATHEHLGAAKGALQQLSRPTDEQLHMRLVSAGPDGIAVVDLDTGRVVLRRQPSGASGSGWFPNRLIGNAIVGSADAETLIEPLTSSGREHALLGSQLLSSTGTPMWLLDSAGHGEAFDETGRRVAGPVTLPLVAITGFGTGSVLLVSEASAQATPLPFDQSSTQPVEHYSLLRPTTGQRTPLRVTGCPQLPALGLQLVAVPTGPTCEAPTQLQLFDPNGRHVRTVSVPRGVLQSVPVVSPDGKYVVLAVGSTNDPQAASVDLLDVVAGTWQTIGSSAGWEPQQWSADSTTLLLHLVDGQAGRGFGQLAYFRLGGSRLHSIRVLSDDTNFLIP
jgi:hypothetical protein